MTQPTDVNDTPTDRATARSTEIFAQHQTRIHCFADRLFAGLMAIQWLAAIAVALWISPRAWAGTESWVHLHVWAALFLGAAIASLPILQAIRHPGRPLTRHVIAVAQMLMSALLIHLSGGRIETHFHIIGSLAFLAVYRDWRVLFTATVVATTDHLLRGLYWPQSVFGVVDGGSWRWLEHAGWVLFQDTFLVVSIAQGQKDSLAMATHQAGLEESRAGVELAVEQRTAALADREAQLRTSQEHLKRIIERAMDAIVTIDSRGLVSGWNPQAEAVFGWRAEEVLGQRLSELIVPPAMRAAHEAGVSTYAKTGEGPVLNRRIELMALRRDGHEFPVELSISPTSTGRDTSFTAFVRDITDRRLSEQATEGARQSALEASRLKSEFLANMSHEIRTPMNGVLGMIGLLLETELSGEQREQADTVRRSAEALLDIINDILDLSKIEAGKMVIEPIPFDLRHAVDEVADILAPRAADKGVEIIVRYAPDAPRYLVGDAGRIRQVLTNLAGNAVKFTHHGHVMFDVNVESPAGDVAIVRCAVTDTGIGIPLDQLDHVFGKFTQADASTTRRYGGSGLGLAISKQLVELMGGEIGVISVAGQGSTFSFSLTLSLASERPTPAPLPPDLSSLRLLIVDDNEVNRRVVHEQVASWNLRDGSFDNGPEALRALREARLSGDPYQLALLDFQMPGMDGEMLARAIKSDPDLRGTVLVMLSSMGLRESARMAEVGVAAYLVKPVRPSQLIDAIAAAWAGRDRGPQPLITRYTLAESRAATAPTPAADDRPVDARVLVAEDNPVNQMVAKQMLEKMGCRVDVAGNGAEALEALQAQRYDIVLMDCQMPVMDGYAATAAIRLLADDRRTVPIVAMTANAMQGDRARCLEAGMDDYLSKPIRANDLARALRRWTAAAGAAPHLRPAEHPTADASAAPAVAPQPVDNEPATATIFARAEILDRLDGDGDCLAEVVRLALEVAPQALARARANLDSGDQTGVAREAHTLKGMLANLAAHRASAAAATLERNAMSGDATTAAEDLARLGVELELLVAVLIREVPRAEELMCAGSSVSA